MDQTNWISQIAGVLQSLGGAIAALIGVYLAHRFALTQKKSELLQRLYEPKIQAYMQIFEATTLVQDAFSDVHNLNRAELTERRNEFSSVVRRNLVWLDKKTANNSISLVNKMSSDSKAEDHQEIQNNISDLQRGIRDSLGVDEFEKILKA